MIVTELSAKNGNFPYVGVALSLFVREGFSCAFSVVSSDMRNPELSTLQMLGLIYDLLRMFQNSH